ncbi:MAG: response regulator [Desulfobacteraceae bacterium]|jgi:heterodisulfide reductase subunit A|nr:response regulator [Desulfobacteraceae bacterium]
MNRKLGKALVVGAGIGGIRAALDLAEFGYGVTLIDRSPHLGGILSQLDYQFPTDRCGMCKMLPLVDRDASSQYCLRKGLFHANIEILLSTEIAAVTGEPGHFQVTLKQHPNWVDGDRCIGCGECADLCAVEVPDDFNAGLANRKAIYLPVPHAIPNPYVIDPAACTRCGACVEICPTQAIQLPAQERGGFRILVVDDELIVRDSLKEWLAEEGFSVDMAASGPEALEQLTRQTYQLMLLDIKMPGMDGVEVLQKAKESWPDLNVIMMTAYATVETAVEAMKVGALEYLIKPFDPETMVPMVLKIYQDLAAVEGQQIETGAIVLCTGTDFFNPASGKNTFGYGVYPNAVTSLEFERLLSGTGPHAGRLVRPLDGKPVHKVAWIQCVGSRDIQMEADFCSNICCMVAIKEALIAKEKTYKDLETTIFYMDMRTFGKTFQRYRDRAETLHGVRFERSRVHSIEQDADSGDMIIRTVDISGKSIEAQFDMVVLTVGQRPAEGTSDLIEMLGLELNPWGFGSTTPFSLTRTSRSGILLGGSFAGLKDIGDSVIQASAAALAASGVIHSSGGSLASEPQPAPPTPGAAGEIPRILTVVCTCGGKLSGLDDPAEIVHRLKTNPLVKQVEFAEQICTAVGWEQLVELVQANKPNRLLIGACLPYVYQRRLQELGRQAGINPALIEVVDVNAKWGRRKAEFKSMDSATGNLVSALETGIAKLKWVEPEPVAAIAVTQSALVIGGGIAGMTAALAIADHGFQVNLVEKAEQLGGNLGWLQHTLEGHSIQTLMADTRLLVERHPRIDVHVQSQVISSVGQVGRFLTTVEGPQKAVQALEHGVTILATGGTEAPTSSYGYGTHPAIITQKELEQKLVDDIIDPAALTSVVMIQCVDSREEPRNYCSRVCCANSLKHALDLKEKNPELAVYILYRDIMAYGFAETYYTRARRAGVLFIQYQLDAKPRVQSDPESLSVTVWEPVIGQQVQIKADLLVLATGVVPMLPQDLAQGFGATIDQDGFFQEAESKWRPVDSLKEGVFACGLAHSPRNIPESIATAEAAAQRALRLIAREHIPSGKVVASVRHSLCSLCEQCIDACPYGARTIDYDHEKVLVNPVMCHGCGSCATVCPNSASILEGFPEQQMFEMIDAAIG